MAERRYKQIGQGLPGNCDFKTADLADGAQPQWDATNQKWTTGPSMPIIGVGAVDGGTSPTFYNQYGVTLSRSSIGAYVATMTDVTWANTVAGHAVIFPTIAARWLYGSAIGWQSIIVGGTNTVSFYFYDATDALADPTDFNFIIRKFIP